MVTADVSRKHYVFLSTPCWHTHSFSACTSWSGDPQTPAFTALRRTTHRPVGCVAEVLQTWVPHLNA